MLSNPHVSRMQHGRHCKLQCNPKSACFDRGRGKGKKQNATDTCTVITAFYINVGHNAPCQNLTQGQLRHENESHNLTTYHDHPMCLTSCFGWKRKPEPSDTPFPPGAGDLSTANKSISPEPAVTTTPSDSLPQVKQQTQIPAVPKSLPSQVDETLAECPR